MNQKEKIEKIKEFRLIDDVFLEVFASDIPACQEILRTILEDEKLTVNEPDECSYCESCVDICPNECITIE